MEHPIFKKIENAKKPDFGDVFTKTFDIYKSVMKVGVTHSIVSFAFILPLIIIALIPILPAYIDMIQNAGNPYYRPTFFEDMSVVAIVLWFVVVVVGSFIVQVINISIYGHFLKYLKNMDTGSNDDIGGYFTIAKKHFGKLVVLTLLTSVIATIAAMLCYLPLFYVMVPLGLIVPIFVFNQDLSASDLLKAAFKLANKHWLTYFGLIWIGSMIASLGMIACYVGIVFTMFITHIINYFLYKDSIGFNEETDEIDVV